MHEEPSSAINDDGENYDKQASHFVRDTNSDGEKRHRCQGVDIFEKFLRSKCLNLHMPDKILSISFRWGVSNYLYDPVTHPIVYLQLKMRSV